MGKPSRDKGARRERELVRLFRAIGLRSDRVPLSGSMKQSDGTGGHDVDLYIEGRDAPYIGECKANQGIIPKSWGKYLDEFDFIGVKPDGKPWAFILTEKMMTELLMRGLP